MAALQIALIVFVGILVYQFFTRNRQVTSKLQPKFLLAATTSRDYKSVLVRLEKVKNLEQKRLDKEKDKMFIKNAKDNLKFAEGQIKELKNTRDKVNKIIATYEDKGFNHHRVLKAWEEYLDLMEDWSFSFEASFEYGVMIDDSHETDKLVILSKAYVELFDLWSKSENYKHD